MQIDPLSSPAPAPPDRKAQLWAQAKELEAVFLSEMLAFSGLDAPPDGFGGGAGEAQFASVLRDEQARLLVDRGGIGLAESLFQSLVTSEARHDR